MIERWTKEQMQQYREAIAYIRSYYPDLPQEAIERAARNLVKTKDDAGA